MNIIKCNKCKRQQPEGIWRYDVQSPWISGSVRGAGLNVSFDVCDACNRTFAEHIRRFLGVKDKKTGKP